MNPPAEAQRRKILRSVLRVIEQKYVNPSAPPPSIAALESQFGQEIVFADEGLLFEAAVNKLLQALGASHTGFFHESKPRAGGKIALGATFLRASAEDGDRWVFQDVHPGGAADSIGIVPGDILLRINGNEIMAPTPAAFSLGESYRLTVRRIDNAVAELQVTLPGSKEKKRPLIVPEKVVTMRNLDAGVGLIRISMFPGVLGMDVARDISRAVAELSADRLIFDLRGNSGGGIGCLRVMSMLCPDIRGVGYSLGKKQLTNSTRKEDLPRFDRIPTSKLQVIPLALRFATAGRSVAVYSEGLGPQRHHAKTVLLVNEHSASATEMIAAFASEERLAVLVGCQTPGRLVGASSFKVGCGYRVALPVAAYFTWAGRNLEGHGVAPEIEAPVRSEDLRAGYDPQLETAIATVKNL